MAAVAAKAIEVVGRPDRSVRLDFARQRGDVALELIGSGLASGELALVLCQHRIDVDLLCCQESRGQQQRAT